MADHAALGRAGRSRRVDVGEEVVLLDRLGGLAERVGLRGGVGAALPPRARRARRTRGRAAAAGARRATPRPSRAAPRPRRGRRPRRSARGCSRRPSASCSRRSRRRSRRPGRARSRRAPTRARVVARIANASPLRIPSASRPFAYASTRSAASAHETGCQSLAVLHEIRGVVRSAPPRRARGARSSACSGSIVLTLTHDLARQETAGPGSGILAVPLELESDAHDLERLDQLRPRQHPRGPRAGDEARRARSRTSRSGCSTASAGRRSSRSAGARPRARGRPDEIVKGWEVAKGQFVLVEEAELEALDPARQLALDRDHPLRRRRRGRPDLLRPHLLPRARAGARPRGARTSCS